MANETIRRPKRWGLADFIHDETAGGIVLALATVAALLWSNLATGSYERVWSAAVGPHSPLHLDLSLRSWVNDALMALFFFVVGLEIKRELTVGELANRRAAITPVMAALGGMLVPAAIYTAINAGGPHTNGWAIPMATDIAFVLGALSLVGNRAPSGLRLFLLAIAIVDDLGAILVIALFYSDGLSIGWLLISALLVGVIVTMRRLHVQRATAYIVPAVALWVAVHESGVHATIAGVTVGMLTPAGVVNGRDVLDDLQQRLHPVTAWGVVPLFALANAGVRLDGDTISAALASRVTWGIAAGLLLGKTVGISLATTIAARSGLGALPAGLAMRHVIAGAMLAGIGFTVALFIADLSFTDATLAKAKVAILATSTLAAILGTLALRSRHIAATHNRPLGARGGGGDRDT